MQQNSTSDVKFHVNFSFKIIWTRHILDFNLVINQVISIDCEIDHSFDDEVCGIFFGLSKAYDKIRQSIQEWTK